MKPRRILSVAVLAFVSGVGTSIGALLISPLSTATDRQPPDEPPYVHGRWPRAEQPGVPFTPPATEAPATFIRPPVNNACPPDVPGVKS